MVLGLLRDTKALQNLEHRPECVLNLPSPELWRQVELLAPLTGLNPVPREKASKFRYVHDKFAAAGFTPLASEKVSAPRVKECPAQLEGTVRKLHYLEGEPRIRRVRGELRESDRRESQNSAVRSADGGGIVDFDRER